MIKLSRMIKDLERNTRFIQEIDDNEIFDLEGKDAILNYLKSHEIDAQIVDLGGDEYIIWDDKIVDPEYPVVKKKKDWLNNTEAMRLVYRLTGMLEDKFNKEFWEYPQPLYHATPAENEESIKQNGLKATHISRGLANRNIYRAVFTSTEPDWATYHYGPLQVIIRTDLMKKDGFMPYVTKEPNHTESDVINYISQKIGAWEDEKDFSSSQSEGTTDDTVIIHDAVPPKYLEITN